MDNPKTGDASQETESPHETAAAASTELNHAAEIAKAQVETWNRAVPVGVEVTYTKSELEGKTIDRTVRPAYVLGDKAVVDLKNIGCALLTKVERFLEEGAISKSAATETTGEGLGGRVASYLFTAVVITMFVAATVVIGKQIREEYSFAPATAARDIVELSKISQDTVPEDILARANAFIANSAPRLRMHEYKTAVLAASHRCYLLWRATKSEGSAPYIPPDTRDRCDLVIALERSLFDDE
ncbi:MAG TPA: hypothetical protein VEC35_09330 [Noviherbaspirillum sp.]|nr:hypothetical protein [Noviherbaspirillum sp.]